MGEEEEIKFVTCPICMNEQADMGRGVRCEECGYGSMPYYDNDGELID